MRKDPIGMWQQFNRLSRHCAVCLACTGLAGCSGETTISPVATTPTIDYLEYFSHAADLHNTWDGIAVTDPATLPVGGAAQFNGVMGLRFQAASGEILMNGALQLDVNFAGDALTGNASAFSDQASNPVSGVLSITGGVLDRAAILGTEYTFSANIDGNLSGNSDSYAVSGDFYGDFRGTSADAAFGIVAVTAISSFGTGYMFGDFISEQ